MDDSLPIHVPFCKGRSFQKPAIFPEFPEVFWKGGSLERMENVPLEGVMVLGFWSNSKNMSSPPAPAALRVAAATRSARSKGRRPNLALGHPGKKTTGPLAMGMGFSTSYPQ